MTDLQELLKQIEQTIAPIRQAQRQAQKYLYPFVQFINEVAAPFFSKMRTIETTIQRWREATKEDIAVMVDNGWYPNWLTFFYIPESKHKTLDELMKLHLDNNWNEITLRILELCPNRSPILKVAFELHKSGNYIASIPLFLAQSDGICSESPLRSFLFTNNNIKEKLNELIRTEEIEINILTDIFLKPFELKNYYNANISKQSAKSKAPNRNGILHGNRRHLDYGTEINSLKCFSLLSFVVYVTKDLMNERG